MAVGGGAVGRILVVAGAAVPQADTIRSNRLNTVRSGHDLVLFMLPSAMYGLIEARFGVLAFPRSIAGLPIL